ncbi:unnamed protein product [Zymoseptoria tritici ST99CH_3D7]|uniref:Chitinase n=1 Tax=Zymoseptoria tritici (strain ST99CH_3D7) TaxID=1276538 RepID=A0A1X7RUW8_ZYMT9|nr:unnamed protein product [Zymoseptoria tritici ST99CH_3D7]
MIVSGAELSLYWGANDSERSLAEYYTDDGAADILILSFLDSSGDGQFPHGNFGNCSIHKDGSSHGCEGLINDINVCHSHGKKIFVGLGGGYATGHLTSSGQRLLPTLHALSATHMSTVGTWTSRTTAMTGRAIAWELWSTPFVATSPTTPTTLTTFLELHNVRTRTQPWAIASWKRMIQFYNNFCASTDLVKDPNDNPDSDGSGGYFDFGEWPAYISGGASKNAKIHVGLPGSKSETPASNSFDYVPTKGLPTVLQNSKNAAGYNGFMIFDAGDSDMINVNGCDYEQQVRRIIDTGRTC